jgi:hypothetical protein
VALLALSIVLAIGPAPRTGFEFGRVGGNIQPFTITIATTGVVRATGAAPTHVRTITKQRLADLNRIAFEARFARLPAVTACPKTLPDVAAQFIRVGGRTVRVHGSCVRGFNRMWAALAKATAG